MYEQTAPVYDGDLEGLDVLEVVAVPLLQQPVLAAREEHVRACHKADAHDAAEQNNTSHNAATIARNITM